uniref:MULE transposase domain-containing protein n=1 Tax=Lactuca sativa TaxID=4236 RepID=A0A9R1V074_LACSA|nr:hypothetical protein LSAT_V11C700367560 [Lactuca sativa]
MCDYNSSDKKPCPFRVVAAWKYNERTFQIKSIVKTHLCARNYKFGSLVTSNWSNLRRTCTVGVDVNLGGINYFKRFYVCFKAFKDGWKKKRCKKVIGLDGCFLKEQVKGELLTAIGRDLDNHIYPIAWAVVIVENKDNWSWLIELLVDDLDLGGGYTYLMARQPETWCTTFFTTRFACEAIENGISECFKSMIKQMRKKPLVTMLEEIRIYLWKGFITKGIVTP